MSDTLLLRPSLHCNTPLHFTQLHFTTLRHTSLHFATLHTSPHFTTLIDFTTLIQLQALDDGRGSAWNMLNDTKRQVINF